MKKKTQTFEEQFEAVSKVVHSWGWHIAIPNDDDEAPLRGMIAGTSAYLDEVLEELPGAYFRSDEDEKNSVTH